MVLSIGIKTIKGIIKNMQTPDTIFKYDFNEFKILINTEGLIKRMTPGFLFHMHATYKLMDMNYLIILFGISDVKGLFIDLFD